MHDTCVRVGERLELSGNETIRPDTSVQVSSFIAGHGIELFGLAKEKGLEGKMAKRAASTYQAGTVLHRNSGGQDSMEQSMVARYRTSQCSFPDRDITF
jgi:CobQ-like glutamine amidotransferase family enzyme